MSWQDASAPTCGDAAACDPIETVIRPKARDLGGFEVRRVLPAIEKRMVGPFVFFDQMGPAVFGPGQAIDVRPHPHIGLSTLTWLFEGSIMHRDSLGFVQEIKPGEVNWMVAGSGIVHSERAPDATREVDAPLFGLQIWMALPHEHEETAPAFQHVKADQLPVIEGDGTRAVVVAGEAWGETSPVEVFWPTLYADVTLDPGATLVLGTEHEERALYLVSGNVEIAGTPFEPGAMQVLKPGRTVDVKATSATRLVAIGGAPMDGPRHMWWNFVSSRKERIEQAKEDWREGRFAMVPGDDAFIPLPEK